MKRLIRIVVAAMAGSTAGYVVHQLRTRKQDEVAAEAVVLTVGAPVPSAVAAAVVGIAAGPVAAFAAGFALSAAAGAKLDALAPRLMAACGRLGQKAAAHREQHHAS